MAVEWSAHPVGLVPAHWLAEILGVSSAAVEYHARRHGRRFGSANSGWQWHPPSWGQLVAAWGEDRARAWLKQWAPDALERFEACVRAVQRGIPHGRLADEPMGVVPDKWVVMHCGLSHRFVLAAREAMGQPLVGRQPNWRRWADDWGEARVEAWCQTAGGPALAAFRRWRASLQPRPRRRAVKPPEVKPKPKPAPLPPPPPPEPSPPAAPLRVESVEEWLRRGGQVKRCPSPRWELGPSRPHVSSVGSAA